MGFTVKQQMALDVRDRTLLLSAGAGSGKTSTLIERIIRTLTDAVNPVDITDLLIVTFTNAAVAEIKTRVEKALVTAVKANPQNRHLERQLTLLPVANIMTVDSLCQEFLKKNAESLGLLPNYRIADKAEISLLAADVMENVLTGFYEGAYSDKVSEASFLKLTDTLVGVKGSEAGIGELLLSLYEKTVTEEKGVLVLSDISKYYPDVKAPEATPFGDYIIRKVKRTAKHFAERYAKLLLRLDVEDKKQCKWMAVLARDKEQLENFACLSTYTDVKNAYDGFTFEKAPGVSSQNATDMEELCKEMRASFKKTFKKESMEKLLACTAEEFQETYIETRERAKTVAVVLSVFDEMFRAEKRRLGVCDYADLERYFYESLWKDGKRTPTAEMLASQYRMIFIDEYQDISPLQHKIFEALSGERNRFMVGDIKQSIYGFRSADPSIFAEMKKAFPVCKPGDGQSASTIYMSENFRCDVGIVNTVNEIFGVLFGAIADSIGYVADEAMIYGKSNGGPSRKTKMYIVQKPKGGEEAEDLEDAVIEDNKRTVAAEAQVIAREIHLLVKEKKNDGTPLSYRDIVILTRGNESIPAIVGVLNQEGIPAVGGSEKKFFKNPSVLLALSLLNTIDNPYRDIYLCGALMSPLYGFTPDDMRKIRETSRGVPLYISLCDYCKAHPDFEKGKDFLAKLSSFRLWAEGGKPDELLFRLYHETGLLSLAVRNHGDDNLWLLYENAKRFAVTSKEGLGAFIRYVNRMLDTGRQFDPADSRDATENAVRVMTIHGSKGLEFPVVFVPECAKLLTDKDGKEPILFSASMGMAPVLFDPTGTVCMETPMRHALKDAENRKKLDEEMRIFYVALTRAAERLYLTACFGDTQDKWEEKKNTAREEAEQQKEAERMAGNASEAVNFAVLEANSFLDWTLLSAGETVEYEYVESDTAHIDASLGKAEAESAEYVTEEAQAEPSAEEKEQEKQAKKALAEALKARFSFAYPGAVLLGVPEKLSVSKLYPTVLDGTEEDETASLDAVYTEPKHEMPRFLSEEIEDIAAKRGIATHAFLQFCDFENLLSAGKEAELSRLTEKRFLSKEDASLVRMEEIEKFCRSALAQKMRRAEALYRELRFHVQLPAENFTEDEEKKKRLVGKQLLVQGVMDCVMKEADGTLTLLDYKTDRLPDFALENPKAAETILREKHEKQLSYYKEAVLQIFGKYPDKTQIYSLALGDTVEL